MNRLNYVITQSNDWYYHELGEFIFFFLVFFLEKTAFLFSFFVHYAWFSQGLNNFSLLVGLLRLVGLLDGS